MLLAELAHFTAAAERLGMSQPALTRTIQRLEKQLGCVLFERTTRHARLTGDGERLRRELSPLLDRLDRVLEPRRDSGTLRLGFSWGFPLPWARAVIRDFEVDHGLRVEAARRDDIVADLGSGALDAALMWANADAPTTTASTVATVLCREPRLAAVSSRSSLAGRTQVAWRELGRRCLVVNTVSGTFAPTDWPAGARPAVGAVTRNFDELLDAVAACRGVGLVPASVAELVRDPDVLFIPVPDAPPVTLRYLRPRTGVHPAAPALGEALRR